ncbi:hypothetical protein ACFO5R_02200 [Halosolutus amylolyticus]|uniref:Uncharacterized protein n=1 Tax=Halosolutus amylolyticus TaxID=2932267 RepID=A0ABD5PJZ7_9EURY|nr:hypothetical protein [Halosolutus amylolyticus]
MDDSEPISWRRDATTSRTVRVLWSLGVGTFFAAIGIIVFWRIFELTGQIGGQSIVVAVAIAIVATILALAASDRTEQHVEALGRRLPITTPADERLDRAMDAAIGAIVMMAVMGTLIVAGRIVSQRDLLAVGAGPFTGLAALTIPLALVAIVLAVFLKSVGTFDPEDEAIYLYDPDQAIDLDVIRDASIRQVGDTAIVKFEYDQPDGQYVQGPRRLTMPPAVAREVQALVRSKSSPAR